MDTILIKNAGWVVTMDPDRRIFADGAVAIEGDRIVEVGKTNELAAKHKAQTVIDATGKLVLPGLIDTHVHNTQQLGRGLADGCEINVHLLERLYGYETAMMAEDAYWAALCCQLELIRAGTTCFIDPGSYFPRETAKAVGERKRSSVLNKWSRSSTECTMVASVAGLRCASCPAVRMNSFDESRRRRTIMEWG